MAQSGEYSRNFQLFAPFMSTNRELRISADSGHWGHPQIEQVLSTVAVGQCQSSNRQLLRWHLTSIYWLTTVFSGEFHWNSGRDDGSQLFWSEFGSTPLSRLSLLVKEIAFNAKHCWLSRNTFSKKQWPVIEVIYWCNARCIAGLYC